MQITKSPAPHDVDALERWRSAAIARDGDSVLDAARTLNVVVPHADDETLGCGGLIAIAAARGIAVTVTILTDGAASHPGSREWPPRRLARRRRSEAAAAVACLTGGAGKLVFCDLADGRLRTEDAAPGMIEAAELFVTCWRDDPHPDHRAAYFIAKSAAARHNARLLAFPLWVLTTDCPVPRADIICVDISAQIAAKRAALCEHRSQLGQLVTDVQGFVLDDGLLDLFVRPDELFAVVMPTDF